ncbi:hypothetical protein B0J17DRAFT_711067 [Rhizoctonia solani]|nr:hypothetical protein B0J17DRAFT_711067 [Rhizoctonia solani]
MGRLTSTTSVASGPAGNGSSWRLSPLISSVFYALLAIVRMINYNPLKLALVHVLGHRDLTTPESSTASTSLSNSRNRNTVVQGRDLSPAVQVEVQNDDRVAPLALIPPVTIMPDPIPPMPRNTTTTLQGIWIRRKSGKSFSPFGLETPLNGSRDVLFRYAA